MVVYKAVNKENGKCYIGQTVRTLHQRKTDHIRTAKNKEKEYPFHRALIKYGENSFEWSIICECHSKEELNEKETQYIKELKSHVSENGYNLTFGGEGNLGWIPSEETKRKISESNKGRKLSEEHCIKQSKRVSGKNNPMYGIKRLDMIGDNNFAKRPEVREKISNALKGKKKPYMIERNKLNSGKTYEEIYGIEKALEIKRKQSEKRKNKIVSDETKKKLSISNKGKQKPTMVGDNNPSKRPEVREKIRQKALERWNRINNET